MSLKLLPNTNLTSMVMNDRIYAYAQQYDGDLYEFRGNLKAASPQSIYTFDKRRSALAATRTEDDVLVPNAPKLFTPLAAVSYTKMASTARMETRYLFYVDDHNILRDIIREDTGDEWKPGLLGNAEGGGIRCAPYSRLAAITIPGRVYNNVCLYYQVPTDDAAIKMVHYNPEFSRWQLGTPNLLDPPLFGTSLTAVRPRPGNLPSSSVPGSTEARQAVYYLQLDDLRLGHAQGISDPEVMSGLELDGKALVFAPQTSLSAVDDGRNLYMVYKSNGGIIKVIEIDNNRPKPPETFQEIRTTPRSSIAACLAPDPASTKIILFYQYLNQATMQVNLCGITLYKATAADASWVTSAPVKLGG